MKIRMTRDVFTQVRYVKEVPYALREQEFEVVSDEGDYWIIESGTEYPFKGELYPVAKDEAEPIEEASNEG